jgi:signal-transduction protein with cAMP-binding, CBS, and nucleotidyltransferase domain
MHTLTKVKDWMIDLVVFIEPDSTVLDALSIMRRRYVNSLIVNKTEKFPEFGIVTSTDICDKIVAEEKNAGEVKIHEIMSSPLISVKREQSIFDCAKKMGKLHIHHLPVTNEEGMVIGMISATDFLVVAEAIAHGEGDNLLR